jgi:hypothetical protein
MAVIKEQSRRSLAVIARTAGRRGAAVSTGTIHNLVKGHGVPKRESVIAHLVGCGVDHAETELWLATYDELLTTTEDDPSDPPFEELDLEHCSPHLRRMFDHLVNAHTWLFAGRDAEIARIQQFVATGAGGYIFIEGLSGYGKTSLLAELVRTNPRYVYHFISQSYKTSGSPFDPTAMESVLANLCEQLGVRPVSYDDPIGMQRRLHSVLSHAAENHTVIVIDAIDEIDRHPNYLYGLLPRPLPPGYTVVLSARTQGDRTYLSDVGLSAANVSLHVTLGGLDEAALRTLLERAGASATRRSRDQRFVERLHVRTQGDPFYLHFLVEDVARGLIHGGNVDSVPSGLDGYLDQQLSQLNRSAHGQQRRDIIGLILEAGGALSRDDLIEMVPGLDIINFNDVLRDIHRFLLVHDHQYTFCHSRFKEYFVGRGR